jgi:hypothetical protein
MIGDIASSFGLGILFFLVCSWLWSKVRGMAPAGVQAAGDETSLLVDKAAGWLALKTLMELFSERGDTETVTALGVLSPKIWAWQAPATAVLTETGTTADATLKSLAADIAALKAKLTSAVSP